MKLCIIDNDQAFLTFMGTILAARKDEGFFFTSPAEAIPSIKKECPDGLIWNIAQFHDQDIRMLEEIRRENPALFVALSGDINGNQFAHHLLNRGSCEFLRKPVTTDLMNALFHQIEAPARFSHPAELHSSLLAKKYRFFELIGNTPEMLQLYEKIEIVSHNQGTVLIQGEIGTGKDHVAKAIHQNSERRRGPFLRFSCSIIPKALFDSELFGCPAEVWNSGTEPKKGALDMAAGGTLFLDEI